MKSAEELQWVDERRPGRAVNLLLAIFIILCLLAMVMIVL